MFKLRWTSPAIFLTLNFHMPGKTENRVGTASHLEVLVRLTF